MCYRMLGKSFKWFCSRCVTCFDLRDKLAGKKPVQTVSDQSTSKTADGHGTSVPIGSQGTEKVASDQNSDMDCDGTDVTGTLDASKTAKKESESDTGEQIQGNLPKVKMQKFADSI